ncbi:Activator of Hsp90 ATPase homolog 1-like protein [Serratia marcescens]|uniref:SRPBCC family protein n=1 Tax=Serratia TaxID=613 RepID=UPI00074542FE|nr:SRPBCC domain-containing protein [Serratia marcescens]QFH59605.1 polyketide cyclase [Serratia marcescens]QSD88875.1 SRPBCC domain-containing protein [Serratia marcescens]CUZ56326.1 Activator of Hsp90 ATPase homolog 1-like protein [Serratia marcescens]
MNKRAEQPPRDRLVLEYSLDAPPEKVWRALSIPELREQWLPTGDLAQVEPLATTPGEAVSYRLRDDQPPFLESVVTLQIVPDAGGGSLLRIIHQLDAANDGPTTMMCAA